MSCATIALTTGALATGLLFAQAFSANASSRIHVDAAGRDNFRPSASLVADAIVQCDVVSRTRDEDSERSECEVTVTMKGDLAPGDRFSLWESRFNPGSPEMRVGRSYLLYLRKCPDFYVDGAGALRVQIEADSVIGHHGEPAIPVEDYRKAVQAAILDAENAATGATVDCMVEGDVLAVGFDVRSFILGGGSITLARTATLKNLGAAVLPDTLVLECGARPALFGAFGRAPKVTVGDRIVVPIVSDSAGFRISRPALSITHRVNPTSTASLHRGACSGGEIDTVALWSIPEHKGP